MSEFQKFVSYINLYQNHQKIKNVGFAKIEKKNSLCMLQLQLKNCNLTGVSCPVYLLNIREEMVEKIEIGKLPFSNGSGMGQFYFQEQMLSSYSCFWKDICGFLIEPSEHVLFISQWNDEQIMGKQFVMATEQTNQSPSIPSTEESQDTSETSATPLSQESPDSFETTSLPYSEESQNLLHADGSSQEEDGSSQEEDGSSQEEDGSSQEEDGDTKKDTTLTPHQKWQLLMENYPAMTPFSGKEDMHCVRIELKDLRIFPKHFRYLGNNSFLIHGFFNYRYLLLGHMVVGSQTQYFLGIPGIFQPQEKIMADLFGFPDFISEKNTPQKINSFGYWCRFFQEDALIE